MRVALVHDYLNQYGGAERVLEALLKIFPEADLYTLMYDAERTMRRFEGRSIKTSFLDFPLARRRHRWFIPLMPAAVSGLTLSGRYDLVVSDSAGYAKGIRAPKETFHLSYCHTPLRYAWEVDNYFNGSLRSFLFKTVFRPAFLHQRFWDRRAARRPHAIVANSAFIAEKIRRYYGRAAPVVHPPVDSSVFFRDPKVAPSDYFLAFGRLLHYKKFDLIIEAFRRAPGRLVIAGGGPELPRLKRRALALRKRIEFVPFGWSDEEIRRLYQQARALIFPQVEDFGLTAAEALSCGTPVIAFRAGGALEIVEEGITGVFFDQPKPEFLAETVRNFNPARFDRAAIARRARRFSLLRFREGITAQLPPELRARLG